MNYEQHNETFHYEMEVLKNSLSDPGDTGIPIEHINKMWSATNTLMTELDQLEVMGTNIPSLTIAALKIRALIFIIPERLNIENKAKEVQHDNYDA